MSAKQCGEHLLCVKNNAVKCKHICICIGSSSSCKRGLQHFGETQEKTPSKSDYVQEMQMITMKYAVLINRGLFVSTVNDFPYA